MGAGNSGSKEGLSLFGNKIKMKYKLLQMKIHDVWYHEVGKRSFRIIFVVFCITGIMNRTRSALGGHMLRFVSLLCCAKKKKKKELKSNESSIPHFIGEQWWCSGDSTRLPPMWPGIVSQTRRHMYVEFVGSLLWSARFFPWYSGFPLSSKT